MEDLRLEEVEDLLEELEEEQGAIEEPPPKLEERKQELQQERGEVELSPRVEELLSLLQSSDRYYTQKNAAQELGKLETSSPRIVQALIAAIDSDAHPSVRRAAIRALRAPVHQQFLSRRHPRSSSFLAETIRGWEWFLVYPFVLIAATVLAVTVTNVWTVVGAAVVWISGWVLGNNILRQKGHEAVLPFWNDADDWTAGCQLSLGFFGLALFAGPVVFLVAMLRRPQQ